MEQKNQSLLNINIPAEFAEHYDYSVKAPLKWKCKRMFDIGGAIIGGTLLFPVIIAIIAAIKIENDGPILFTQQRIGMHGKLFTMYKFRTMVINADESKVLSDNDSRITRVGHFLRKYSLDEIPQLFNIIKGDMSLVGPRPVRPIINQERLSMYPTYNIRYVMKPGLRINYGRLTDDSAHNLADIEREYIKNWSLSTDLKIFLNVMSDVIKGKNY